MHKLKLIPIIVIIILVALGLVFLNNSPVKNIKNLVSDKTKPVITLTGESTTKINLFSDYSEPGFSAKDDTDGDITSKVITSNDIKINRIGTYHVNYSVSDKNGNKATAVREVVVLAPSTNNSNGIPVLMYHFFYDSSIGETPEDSNFTDSVMFDQQMKYLVDNSYYFPTWDELVSYINGNLYLPEKSIIITADDGNPTFFNKAYPILVKYQIPATSFLITSWSGNPDSLNVDRSLISFQSHSHAMHDGGCSEGHGGRFMCIDYKSGIDDLNTSKQILGSSDAFCYPFGDYNDSAKQMLSDTGFKVAVTTEYGNVRIGDDKLSLPRIRISGGIDLSDFISSIN